jgi:integrase
MLDVAPGAFKALLAFSIYGGLRKGEILELRRKDIEIIDNGSERWIIAHVSRGVIWDNGKAIVRKPKTSAGVRSVQLHLNASPIIIEHLKDVAIHPDSLLFTRAPGVEEHWSEHQINPTWKKIRAQAGFPHRFHSTRSFHLTYFGITGASLAELMERGGHRDIKTAMRYQRVTGRESELLRKMS